MNDLSQDLEEASEFAVNAAWNDHRRETASVAAAGKQYFDIIDMSGSHDDPALLAVWREMLARGTGPEKLYQTPEFFRTLEEANEAGPRTHHLYVVRRQGDGALVGIVPVRKSDQELVFGSGPIRLCFKLSSLQILGSVPLLDRSEPRLMSFLFRELLRRHPECSTLSMQTVPEPQLAALDNLPGLAAYVQNGVRECHTVPLPETVDAYLQKFSSKKRYNLNRQVRLLSQQAGEVELCRIDEPALVVELIEAMRTVLTPYQFAGLARQQLFERMARHGLLLSYVIRCGSENVAVVIGTRSADVWHLHNIVALPKYQGLSAGTSAMHLALQDVITHFSFSHADFGYGTPNQEFRSTHVLKGRASVLVCRSRKLTSAGLAVHNVYEGAFNVFAGYVKEAMRKLNTSRNKRRKPVASA